MVTWTKVPKPTGNPWTKVPKPVGPTSTGGTPIGLLLALTRSVTIPGFTWTPVPKAVGALPSLLLQESGGSILLQNGSALLVASGLWTKVAKAT